MANYRASLAPIRKCPSEILAAIFRSYLEDNPRRIRRLLLVCRLWHNLTLQTPDLWTNIPIIFDSGSEAAKDVVDSIKPRILACIKYSRNLPLDIDLDLRKLCPTLTYIENQGRIFEENYLQGIDIDMLHGLGDHWPLLADSFSSTPWNSSHIFELLSALAGSGKENLKRWKSFSFALPEGFMDDDTMPIWDALAGPLPSLVSLSINQSDEYDPNIPNHMAFTDLKSLRHLTLNDTNHLSCLDIIPTTIRILDIHLRDYQEMHNIRLNRFRFLRVLKLTGYLAQTGPTLILNLPELESIAFMGAITSIEMITFNLPLLKHLFIQRSYPTYFVDPPALSAASITWIIRGHSGEERAWTTTLKEEALKTLLRRYSSVELLIITESTEDALLSVIGDLKHTGELPPSFRIVRIASDRDVETILRTRTLA